MYKIYYRHPELGEIVVSIIRGKPEAVKKLNELNEANKKHGVALYMSPYKE